MSQPKVSIIVPVYNVERYLDRCINSLRNQSLSDIEIILVDDSSPDSSLQICRKAAEEDSRIKVIHKVNEGAGKARNAGLEIATGEYIGFVDSDDFVEKDMYKTLCEKAEKHEADLVIAGMKFVDGNIFSESGECIIRRHFDVDTLFETQENLKELKLGVVGAKPEDSEDSKYGMGTAKNLFKKEIIDSNNVRYESERETLSEDALFLIDYISHIKKAVGIPDANYNYCRNGDSITKSYNKERFNKSLVFVDKVEKRFENDIDPEEYHIYIDRFWQAMCRVLCSQEIMHSVDKGTTYTELKERLKSVCTHPLTRRALKSYPIGKLPLKQMVFAFAIKHRMYLLMKLLVMLRNG